MPNADSAHPVCDSLIHIRAPVSLNRRLRDAADRAGSTISAFVRAAVEAEINRQAGA